MQAQEFIGVDVSKAELVIFEYGCKSQPYVIANESAAIEAWLRDKAASQTAIAMESTGRYHLMLAHLAHAVGLKVYILNAKDVYFYAKALGARGKTDQIDSKIIARYLAEHHVSLHVWTPASPQQSQIWTLLKRRAEVVKYQRALRQGLEDLPCLTPAAKSLDEQFDTFIQEIDCQIQQLVRQDTILQSQCANLKTIIGVGEQTSALLATLFTRLQFSNANAVVAYSGLDPRPCDSGKHRGRRRLSKRGPAFLRKMMYLVAFSSVRNKAVKPIYAALKAKGFAPTQALVIIARKLLRIAFAVWKTGQPFDFTRLGTENA